MARHFDEAWDYGLRPKAPPVYAALDPAVYTALGLLLIDLAARDREAGRETDVIYRAVDRLLDLARQEQRPAAETKKDNGNDDH